MTNNQTTARDEVLRGLAHASYAGHQMARHAANISRSRREAPEHVVLTIDGDYPELPPVQKLWQRRLFPPKESMRDLAACMHSLAEDSRVRGVVLHLRPLEVPATRLESMRDLVAVLRDAGKHVTAWSSRYTTATYYVATAANEILLQPGGEVAPLGIQRSYAFLADSLEQIGLSFDGLQITPYKSALDTLTRREMSDEAREMANWLIDASFDELRRAVAAGRGIDADEAQGLIDGAPYTDVDALASRVVDAVVAEEDLPAHLGGDAGAAALQPWARARSTVRLRPPERPGRHVALIRIEGSIVDGESARPPSDFPSPVPLVADPRSGDLTVVRDARQALHDERVAAVVVYIDSPGGSATASEAMAAALTKLAERKPVVAAMGSFAASGGYYVATPASWIIAQPDTLTGSIGVLTGKLVGAGLLDRLRVSREHLRRGRNADLYGAEQPFTADQREAVWGSIQRVYEVFLDRVAESRGMTRDSVDAVGGGRVWTGRQALEHGLVDELGGLETALAKARELGGLSPRASARVVTSGKTPLAPVPVPEPTAALSYAAETVRLLGQARTLYLCSLDWREEH